MDPISAWIANSDRKIAVGEWGSDFFEFLTTNFAWFFDSLASALTSFLNGLIDLASVAAARSPSSRWPSRRLPSCCNAPGKLSLGVALGLLFIINQGLWKETDGNAGACRRRRHRVDGDRRADRHLGGA
jgi:glycine betaine/proline transport system permease protein